MFRPLLIAFLAASLLPAQGRLRPDGPPFGPRREMRRDAIMHRLHQMRMHRIQQSLGVPEAKARAIADAWADFDQDSMERRRELRQLREQTNGILVGPGTEDEKNARLRPLLDRLAARQKEQQEARQAFEASVRAQLTPAQQARFILLMDEFQRALQDALDQQRRGR